MANTTSAKKAARKMIRRTEINKARRSRLKAFVRKFEEAVASGDKVAAKGALAAAEPILVRTAQKGVIHPRAASRKVSRLTARLKAMA
jgi:small subunit ribosomal protein S20